MAIRPMICGIAFIAGLIAAVIALPMVHPASPDIVIQGISPLVPVAGFH
jgi:hypothetical protein